MQKRTPHSLLALVFGLAVVSGVVYGAYLFGERLFIFPKVGSDTYYQYWPFDRYFGELLRSGELRSWTFRIALGKQIFAYQSYLNPFVLFVELMPAAWQAHAYVFKMILECFCAAFLWRLYLSSLGLRGRARVVFPLLYGFNGYLVLWGQHAAFGILFSLVPLTLYAYEQLLQRGRTWPLVLSLTFFLAISYYFFFLFTVFFAVFAPCRAAARPGAGFSRVVRVCLKTGACYAGAFLLDAWTVVPTMSYLATSPRLGARPPVGLFATYWWGYYVTLFRVFSNNVFGAGLNYRGPINYFEPPQLSCGILPLLLLPQFFVTGSRKERLCMGLVLGFLAVSLVSPFLANVFNGLASVQQRHGFTWIVLCLFLAARVFDRQEAGRPLHPGALRATCALLCVPLIAGAAAGFALWCGALKLPAAVEEAGLALMRTVRPDATPADFAYTLKQEFIPAFTAELGKALLFLVAYAVALLGFRRRPRPAGRAVVLLVMAELIVWNHPTVNQRAPLLKHELHGGEGYFDATGAALRTIRRSDASFYRVDKTDHSVFLNDPLFQGYFGTSGYCSVQEPSTLDFLHALRVPTYQRRGPNYIAGFGERDLLNSLTAVKYLLSREPVDRDGFRLMATVRDVRIYRNERALPLGFVYHRVLDPGWFASLEPPHSDRALLEGFVPGRTLRVRPDVLARYERADAPFDPAQPGDALGRQRAADSLAALRTEPLEISAFREDRIRGRVVTRAPGLLFLSIPFNRGWRARVDGEPASVHRVNLGFIGIPLERGTHRVELWFAPYRRRIGVGISVLAGIAWAFIGWVRGRPRPPARPPVRAPADRTPEE